MTPYTPSNTPELSRFQAWFQRVPLIRSRRGIFFLIAGLLVLWILFRLITQNTTGRQLAPPALQSPSGSEGSITISGGFSWPEYPRNMAIYSLESYTPILSGAQAWAQQLGLEPSGSFGRAFINSNGTQTLSVSPNNQAINYTDLTSEPVAEDRVDSALTERYRDSFLQNIGFQLENVEITATLIEYQADAHDHRPETTSLAEAAAIEYRVRQKLDGFPLFWEAGNAQDLILLVTNRGVSSASLANFPLTVSDQAVQRNTFSQEQIQNRINRGNYVIVGTIGHGMDRGSLTDLRVENVSVEYRVSELDQAVKPFIRLAGMGTFTDGQILSTQILTPLTQ